MKPLIHLLRVTVLFACAMWFLTRTPSVHAMNCDKFNATTEFICNSCCSSSPPEPMWTDGYSEGPGIQVLSPMYANCGSPTTSCPTGTQYTGCTAGNNPWYQAVTDSACCSPSGLACNAGACCSPFICLSGNTCGYCRSAGQSCGSPSDCCNGNCSSGTCATACPQTVPGGCPCGSSGRPIDTCSYPNNNGCPGGYAPSGGECRCSGSPVLISLIRDAHSNAAAFPLTSLSNGVHFAITTDPSSLYPISWTTPGSEVAFVVHFPTNYVPGESYTFNGGDLFGNFTPQPPPTKDHQANGYAALLVWDNPENGGNGDGLISLADQAVQRGIAPGGIALWINHNHDGVAQAAEVYTFAQSGIESIGAGKYRRADWTDSYGNRFRYKAPVYLSNGERTRSFDVFLNLGEVVR